MATITTLQLFIDVHSSARIIVSFLSTKALLWYVTAIEVASLWYQPGSGHLMNFMVAAAVVQLSMMVWCVLAQGMWKLLKQPQLPYSLQVGEQQQQQQQQLAILYSCSKGTMAHARIFCERRLKFGLHVCRRE